MPKLIFWKVRIHINLVFAYFKQHNKHSKLLILSYMKVAVWKEKRWQILLTLFFVQRNLQLAFLSDYNYARSVTNLFEKLYIELRLIFSGKYSMYCSLITEVSSQILKHLNTISILILERSLETRALTIFKCGNGQNFPSFYMPLWNISKSVFKSVDYWIVLIYDMTINHQSKEVL